MKTVQDFTYPVGATVAIDDTVFLNCTIEGCQLLYAGGDFAFENTVVQNCDVRMIGPAERAIKLGVFLRKSPAEQIAKPQKKAPGSVQ